MSTAKPAAAKPATKARKTAATVAATTNTPAMETSTADGPVAEKAIADVSSDPDQLTPATEMEASGALIEPEIVKRVDTTHPAVDANPRAGLPEHSNRIDFNDPTLSGADAVPRNLAAQGQS